MAGQDWFEKDFYATLGVPKNADAAAIKKAYRKLARTLHPDHNPDDAASEARFKEVGEAYAVLSDPEERRQYDAIRAMAGGGARFSAPGGAGGAGAAGFDDLFGGLFGAGAGAGGPGGQRVRYTTGGGGSGGFEDILGGLFGGGAGAPAGFRPNRAPQRGADVEASTTLPFRQAFEGSTVTLTVEGRRVNARIPAGVRDGQRIRLRGKGRPGEAGAPAGDLVISVHVEPHPVFTIDGKDLRVTVPVTFPEAVLGTQIDVPTVDGSTVRVKVPEGTPSGRTLRVRGRGVQDPRGAGDLLVSVQVVVPQRLSAEARAAVEAFANATGDADVRADLRTRAQQ